MGELDAALAAIRNADHAAALEHLLVLWDDTRNAAIGWCIDLVEFCATGFEPSLQPAQIGDLVAATPIARGAILRYLAAKHEKLSATDGLAWCELLATLPPDPRALPLLYWLNQRLPLVWIPETAEEDRKLAFSDPLTAKYRDVCVRHGPARLQSPLDIYGVHGTTPRRELSSDSEKALLVAEMVLRRRLFDDDGDRAAIAPFTDPADRDALTAYADWLTARGDLRGAMIAWGPTPGADRFRALWLGPLGRCAYPHLGDDGIVRVIQFDKPLGDVDWRALEIGWRPGWTAVEELRYPPEELLATVALPGLRILHCRHDRVAAAVAAGADLTELDVLYLDPWRDDEYQLPSHTDVARLQALLRAPQLRGLRELKLDTYGKEESSADAIAEIMSPLFVDPCGLPSITVFWRSSGARRVPAPQWLRVLRASGSPLRRFRSDNNYGERWIFSHSAEDVLDWAVVRVEWWSANGPNESAADNVGAVVRAGAMAITVVARQPLPAHIAARLADFDCDITVEVVPALEFHI
jgi:hypothetical protein